MKNIKLITIIILLVIANLYVFNSIIFDIKYSKLINEYSQLSYEYRELENKYIEQEEKLQEVMLLNSEKKLTLKEKLKLTFNMDNNKIPDIKEKLKIYDFGNILEIVKNITFSN